MWLKYFGKWTDTRGTEWGLRVWSNDDVEGEAVELELGSEAVTVEWSDSEDLFEVVRSSTAKINVVADDIITGLQPRNNREMVVEVLRGWRTWWVGMMSADVLTQGYDDGVRVVTYQAKDRLSVLDGVEITDATLWGTGRFGTVNLLQLLYEMTTVLPMVWERWWFPVDVMPVFDGETVDIGDVADCRTLQLLEVSRYNFYTEGDGDKGEEDYERWSKSTYGDVLRCVCGAMGWVAVERGNELWFVNPAVSVRGGDYRAVELADLRGWLTGGVAVTGGSARSVRTWASEDMVCGGADDEYSRYQGYRKVKVVAKNNSWGSNLLESVTTDDMSKISDESREYIQTTGEKKTYCRQIKFFKNESDLIEFFAFVKQKNADGKYELVPDETGAELDFFGARMLQDDCYFIDEENEKKRYDFTERINVRLAHTYDLKESSYDEFVDDISNNIILRYKTVAPVAITKGALVINGDFTYDFNDLGQTGFYLHQYYGNIVDDELDLTLWDNKELLPYANNPKMMLRIGNKWWSGNEWVDEETVFDLLIDLQGGKITDTKKLSDGYNQAPEGMFIPVDGDFYGELEFCMYMPQEYPAEVFTGKQMWNMYFSNIELSYLTNPDGTGTGTTDMPSQHTYSVSMDNGYEEERESVELEITSKNDSGGAYSQLRNGARGLTGLVSRVRERTGKMERLLVDEIAKQQGEAWTVKRLRVEVQEGLMPADVVMNDGVQYLALGRSVDTGEGTERLTLVEVRV